MMASPRLDNSPHLLGCFDASMGRKTVVSRDSVGALGKDGSAHAALGQAQGAVYKTIQSMNLRNILVPMGMVGLLIFGFVAYGWPGVAAVGGGLVMWGLLHFTRLMNVMKKAANRPIGYVSSAVMLNARLSQGDAMVRVIAMTQSLGELLSAADVQPEVYRWTDRGQSHVTCEFQQGKLMNWTLFRPEDDSTAAAEGQAPAAP